MVPFSHLCQPSSGMFHQLTFSLSQHQFFRALPSICSIVIPERLSSSKVPVAISICSINANCLYVKVVPQLRQKLRLALGVRLMELNSESRGLKFTAQMGNSIIDKKGEPLTLRH